MNLDNMKKSISQMDDKTALVLILGNRKKRILTRTTSKKENKK
jgi:hypothetical protein